MINKITFLSLFLIASSSLQSMNRSTVLERTLALLSQKQLHTAACKAIQQKDQDAATLLLQAGAKPPIYTAAKTGNRLIAKRVANKAYNRGLETSKQKRKRVLYRLILTGDSSNLETYFTHKVLTAADITPKSIEYARRRAAINASNKHILKLLKQREKRARLQAKQKAEIQFNQTECTICLEGFKDKEIQTLPCKHVFHPDCCKPWFESRGFKQCPTCKQPENKHLANSTPDRWLQWIHG